MARATLVLACLLALLAAAPAEALRHGDRIPRGADGHLRSKHARAAAAGAVSQLASAPWCGTATTTDDVAHQSTLGNAVKVVYAHTSDKPDRSAGYADVVQRDLKLVTEAFLAS